MLRGGLQLEDLGPEPQRGLRRGLWAFTLLVLAALIAVTFIERDSEESALIQSAQRETDNLARSIAQHGTRTIGESDRVLRVLMDDIASDFAEDFSDLQRLQDLLMLRLTTAPELRTLSIVDVNGTVIASSADLPSTPVSVADRFYFNLHRDSPALGLILGPPVPGRLTGTPVITLSRRMEFADGSFRGVIVAGLDPSYFAEFYQAIDLGPRSEIALLDTEGRLFVGGPSSGQPGHIVSWPLLQQVLAGGNGGTVAGSGFQGRGDYIFAYRRLADYPMLAVVGLDREAMLSSWGAGEIWRLGLVTMLGLGLLALTAALIRSIGQIYESRRVAHSRAQALATVIDSISDGLMLIDAEGRVLLQNPKAVEIFGGPTWRIGLDHQPTGTTITRLNGVTPLPDDERPLQRALQGEAVDQQLYLVRRSGDAAVTVVSGSSRPVRDTRGQVIGAVALLRDVTQQRQLDERARTTQRLEALGQLTGGVAHDFNNLLTVITGSAEELLSAHKDEATRHSLAQMILETAERGSHLTRHLLSFARQQTLAPRPLDVNEQLQGLQGLLVRSLGSTIDIQLKLDPDLWPAQADASQLETAVINLAVNARDAMPGGGKLVIATQRTAIQPGKQRAPADSFGAPPPDVKPGEYVTISVADAGQGMLPEVARRAFDPFFTTKDVGKGTGLGLSMVYGFAQQSGGFVTLETRPGAGTTVYLHLPRAAGLRKVARPPAPAPAQAAPATDERILLVEDDVAVRRLVEEQLVTLGYRVTTAEDGRTALGILAGKDKFELMLTDLVMPNGVDGLTLAQEARRLRPDLKIVLATGIADHASLLDRKPDASIRILPKPFRGRQLARLLRELLDESAGEKASS